MIRISEKITINRKDLKEVFVRSPGPGGQNVNKVSTGVKLFFNAAASLPGDIYNRLKKIAGKKVNQEGFLVIQASRFRKRDRNRRDAMERLIRLIRKAEKKPRKRVMTSPTPASKEKRLQSKQGKSRKKKLRKKVVPSDE